MGLLNDTVFSGYGPEAIRYSLASVFVVMGSWACLHFILGARALEADLRAKDA